MRRQLRAKFAFTCARWPCFSRAFYRAPCRMASHDSIAAAVEGLLAEVVTGQMGGTPPGRGRGDSGTGASAKRAAPQPADHEPLEGTQPPVGGADAAPASKRARQEGVVQRAEGRGDGAGPAVAAGPLGADLEVLPTQLLVAPPADATPGIEADATVTTQPPPEEGSGKVAATPGAVMLATQPFMQDAAADVEPAGEPLGQPVNELHVSLAPIPAADRVDLLLGVGGFVCGCCTVPALALAASAPRLTPAARTPPCPGARLADGHRARLCKVGAVPG